MAIACWVLALLGAIVTWVMLMADAMSSGPRLDRLPVVIFALPLPVVAAALSSMRLYAIFTSPGPLSAGSIIAAGFPLLLAMSTLAILVAAFFIRGG